ncbi:MAG: 16S rRNA (adenine(1518)-N(6)/adenine(1519)-N(6))-dimethyltransferase RsmA [Bdellovibrionaceae bacterium]|nr:16S rRNA (adenine(1518)-N(6)/adenine(1519)-N(6))-dimethyltransferase RsmA [Pseudobdellovibrionaceae bacterium]MDW8189817.1 16S rRNA (adenine(1518)-N(6)/adenine(1519)-N(6))-dimethyltransferase RsmA [Pseudobdellovibrionaceae bacterium]
MSVLSTLERIKNRQRDLEFRFKKSLGQNFLISDSVIGKIIQTAKTCIEIFHQNGSSKKNGKTHLHLIEVGPGLGSLTDHLKNLGLPLILLEFDSQLVAYWRELGQSVIEGDALRLDWSQFSDPYIVVSNLPYQIAASFVIDRSTDSSQNCQGMVLMFQKEVAERITASVGSREYGFLSVVSQSFWHIRRVVDVLPDHFYPKPKVKSRVLLFLPQITHLNREEFKNFIKKCFLHPRKTLSNNWRDAFPNDYHYLLSLLRGYSPQVRPHQVSVSQYQELFAKWQELIHISPQDERQNEGNQ